MRLMHCLHRVHHVFVRLFDGIEFHLLLRGEERADLRVAFSITARVFSIAS